MTSDPKADPLAPDLAELLAAERRAISSPPDAEARVFARLSRSVLLEGTGGSPLGPRGGWRLGSPAAVAAVFGLGVAAGAVAARVVGDRPAPALIDTGRVSTPSSVPSAPIPSFTAPLSPAPTSAASSAAAPSSSSPSSSSRALAEERALLEVARTALLRGDGASSLAATERHEKQYPHGFLTEEREALAVQALVSLKRFPEATARGSRFEQRFPRSVMSPAVKDALQSIP